MALICKKCRKPPRERGLFKCDRLDCGGEFVEEDDLVGNLSKPEIEAITHKLVRSKEFWKWAGIAFGLLVIGNIGVILAGYRIVVGPILRKSVYNLHTNVNQRLDLAYQDVTNRIAKEFEEPRIKQTVSEVAKSYATNMMRGEIEPKVARFESDLAEYRASAESNVAQLRATSEYGLLVFRAMNDDRAAYDALLAIRDDRTSPFQQVSMQVTSDIAARFDKEALEMEAENRINPWPRGGTNTSATATFAHFVERYNEMFQYGRAIERSSLLKEMMAQTRFHRFKTIPFLIDVMQREPSLQCRSMACRLMSNVSGEGYNLLGVPVYVRWWAEHKGELEAEYLKDCEAKAKAESERAAKDKVQKEKQEAAGK